MIRKLGIILNGVTGRMGTNQHLIRSIGAIIREGGLRVSDDLTILPDPVLTGRNPEKLQAVAAQADLPLRVTTDLGAVLADPSYPVFFDASVTPLRPGLVRRAAAAGKAIYCEKPTACTFAEALDLAETVERAGVPNGVVQDKLWLPGIVKFRELQKAGRLGRILSVRGEFGYWVFTGHDPAQPAQRPSWNYRAADGGGIITDMFCHWRYLLDDLFGGVRRVCATGATHIPERVDESGKPYAATADDAAYAMFELGNGAICQLNSSWCVRVRRDDLVTFQVDGTEGSAVFGLRRCWYQSLAATPRPVWNPDAPQTLNFLEGWEEVPDAAGGYPNAFRVQWERFLRHVVLGEPFPWTFREAAKGVQLADLGLQSWREERWLDVPPLPMRN